MKPSNSSETEKAIPAMAGEQSSTKSDATNASNKPDGSKKTIVFSTFYETDFIKEAIKKYEEKHPNITIELNFAQAIGDDANWDANHEKFLKTTNTQLLSGKGPDLMEMDQLPMDQYVNKKLLVNLSERMDNDASFHRDDYFTNILDNIKLDGGVYGIPVRFYLYNIIGDLDAIEKTGVTFDDKSWTWNQFLETAKELARKGDRQYAFAYKSPEMLLNELVQANYTAFVDQANNKGKLESAIFINLLKQIKMMNDDKIVSFGQYAETYFNMEIISSVRNYMLAGTGYQDIFKKVKVYNKPKAEGQAAGGFFRPETTIGINAKSSVSNEAWDFIKFLISDEVQSGGFSLNKSAYQKQVQQILEVGSVKADEEGPLKGKELKVTAADIQQLESYLNDANHSVEAKATQLQSIIAEESAAFFNGQKSAEAVAKLIQNRAMIYLNE
ncbi:ABC transporter substrate-binding protein [Paenibacillus psychroresistens]|uniref:ABC transporter substrate-binding protein n=1 Tax=Paenibacillus psychroresistens TaxID=1778678 RepID=UPI001D043409|nr:extracellular solute-binding protein [Paenibacillus psychroresistens]